jgi:hypothetical protein
MDTSLWMEEKTQLIQMVKDLRKYRKLYENLKSGFSLSTLASQRKSIS